MATSKTSSPPGRTRFGRAQIILTTARGDCRACQAFGFRRLHDLTHNSGLEAIRDAANMGSQTVVFACGSTASSSIIAWVEFARDVGLHPVIQVHNDIEDFGCEVPAIMEGAAAGATIELVACKFDFHDRWFLNELDRQGIAYILTVPLLPFVHRAAVIEAIVASGRLPDHLEARAVKTGDRSLGRLSIDEIYLELRALRDMYQNLAIAPPPWSPRAVQSASDDGATSHVEALFLDTLEPMFYARIPGSFGQSLVRQVILSLLSVRTYTEVYTLATWSRGKWAEALERARQFLNFRAGAIWVFWRLYRLLNFRAAAIWIFWRLHQGYVWTVWRSHDLGWHVRSLYMRRSQMFWAVHQLCWNLYQVLWNMRHLAGSMRVRAVHIAWKLYSVPAKGHAATRHFLETLRGFWWRELWPLTYMLRKPYYAVAYQISKRFARLRKSPS